MRISDENLRKDRLVFYEQDVRRLDGELDGFLEFSGARCAVLIDREGHLVTRRGDTASASLDTLAALMAGSFAATKEIAHQLGEESFSTLLHQGDEQSIQASLVGERTLLCVVWDERSNAGLIRFYAQETTKRLEQIFEEMAEGVDAPGEVLSDGYSNEATAALDDLF
ncbi:MAG: roadblock/LC7 domain-containing protein [Planctomycetota bacterium]|nr:roadblock/LC7 domain-containing protein [Planctomycetota bacterium]